jgi:hypothetical protein
MMLDKGQLGSRSQLRAIWKTAYDGLDRPATAEEEVKAISRFARYRSFPRCALHKYPKSRTSAQTRFVDAGFGQKHPPDPDAADSCRERIFSSAQTAP